MLHGRAISGNVRAINFRVRKFGQKSDTRRTVSHDKILHRTSVCAVSEPTCSISTGGRAYEKREHGSRRKNCKTREGAIWHSCNKKGQHIKVRQMYPEAWHMFYLLENENNLVPPLEIQGTMEVLKNDQIRLLWFIHPIMINEWNMENCILFANEVNRELGNGGRFWVDTEYFDFAYEERFEEEMLQLSGMNVLERHMFEWPLGQFRDIHIPLMMLLQGKWGAETAIRFIKELRENGFVENEKYDLFPDA